MLLCARVSPAPGSLMAPCHHTPVPVPTIPSASTTPAIVFRLAMNMDCSTPLVKEMTFAEIGPAITAPDARERAANAVAPTRAAGGVGGSGRLR